MTIEKISLGGFDVYGLRDGYFYLDGGSMFGVVPKVLWEKLCPPDEKNRIKMGLNSFLIQTQRTLILLETGIGTELNPKFRDFYSVERKPGLLGELDTIGIGPEDVDVVVNSHLHFDHCGGNTRRDKDGDMVPVFPRAKYIIQKGEWEYALSPSYRDKPSYMNHNFLPLQKFGCVRFVEGDTEVYEGIEVILAPGHTLFHQCVKVTSNGNILFFLGDLIPMSAHVGLSYIMSYDLYPLKTLEMKEKTLEKAIAEDWTMAFVHDPNHYFGKIQKENNKYVFRHLTKSV